MYAKVAVEVYWLKKTSVQNAAEEKPKDEPNPVTAEKVAAEQTQTVDAANAIPTVDGILQKIGPKKLQMAAEMGVPLDDILELVRYQENTLKAITESLSNMGNVSAESIAEELKKKLEEGAQKQRAQMTERTTNAPQKEGGSTLHDIIEVARETGALGGGGGDDDFSKMAKAYALESMSLGNTFQKVMMAKMAPELADTLLAGVKKAAEAK